MSPRLPTCVAISSRSLHYFVTRLIDFFCSQLQLLEGNRGLLFTNDEPKVVLEWFESYKKPDFARSGNVIDETFVLPAGTLPLSHWTRNLYVIVLDH